MPDFADDVSTELERKAKALRFTCLVELATYLVLFGFMATGNPTGARVWGTVHGVVVMAFIAMVVMIRKEVRWTWLYAVAVIVTGPIGALLVHQRLGSEGVPLPLWRQEQLAAKG